MQHLDDHKNLARYLNRPVAPQLHYGYRSQPGFGALLKCAAATRELLVAICVMDSVIMSPIHPNRRERRTKSKSVWQTAKSNPWTSITYSLGLGRRNNASMIRTFGFTQSRHRPNHLNIFFTYWTYVKNIEASEAQAEVAQRHVEELSGYVAELRRLEDVRNDLLLGEQRARSEAEAANRVKDEFLATLSHELRTPLTSVLGWSNILRGNSSDEALLNKGLEAIERNAKVQTQLIDDLLDVSRIISGKLHLDVRPIAISSVIEAAITVMRPAADAKSIRLTYRHEPAIGAISGDSARLQQIVGICYPTRSNSLPNAVV